MINKIKSWLAPPIFFGDEESTRHAAILNSVAWSALGITVVLTPFFWLAGTPRILLWLLAPLGLAEIIVLVWLKQGKLRPAGWLLVVSVLLATLIPSFFQGGLNSTFLYFFLVIVTLSGLLLGPRSVDLITLFLVVAATLMLVTSNNPLLPQLIAPSSALGRWIILIASLFLVRTLFLMAKNSLRAALDRAQHNERRLEESYRSLEKVRMELEMRIAERTADLELHARQLQVSAEVISAINAAMSTGENSPNGSASSPPDLDQLLSKITHLVSERFNYYAVNIFMLETGSSEREGSSGTQGATSREHLEMRAANTQAGLQLIENGYTLSIDQPSIVASAARTRMPRLAADVRQDDQYMESIDFPHTRSEAALPLVTGGRLLGVLDVQSSQPIPLTREDLSVLQTLANQVAIAIENAQLFATNQKTLQSLQRAYGNLSRDAWQNLLRAQPDRGYRAFTSGEPTPVTDKWHPDMIQARQSGQIVFGPDAPDSYTLAVPIKIRDQVTGVVRLRKSPEAGAWRQEEVALVETLSDRLSAALESARLYEGTRRTAERERLTGEITARMRSTNDPQAILQIAAHELRKALQADKAQLMVQAAVSPSSPASDDQAGAKTGAQP